MSVISLANNNSAHPHHQLSTLILPWFYEHGRHDLPWQQLHSATPDPYPVWISEIMLQQTQVATVKGYYLRFMARFPNIYALAEAPLDDVLALWAGLGYYARARNLHRSANELVAILNATGSYPQTVAAWQALPGIGRSTAGAIVSMGLAGFGVICDGNVKRVLTRYFAIADDIAKHSTDKTLWHLATLNTPKINSGHYAQAMMDLGATICSRTNPKCHTCPLQVNCQAHHQNQVHAYPVKTKARPKPTHTSHALILRHQGRTLWLERAATGLWGGLWCLPLNSTTLDMSLDETVVADLLGHDTLVQPSALRSHASIRHSLTHFHWQLLPTVITLNDGDASKLNQALSAAGSRFDWQDSHTAPKAIPTAIKKLAPWHIF